MSSSECLERWQAVTRSALAAPPERQLLALCEALDRREELVEELSRFPAELLGQDLADRMLELEGSFARFAQDLLRRVALDLEELRRVRVGTLGYRAARPNHATFLSRSA